MDNRNCCKSIVTRGVFVRWQERRWGKCHSYDSVVGTEVDQLNVYGANNVFDTPADQERYIRNWLNQSANLKKASVDLNIAWYTAWQNKVENSIYSMGDITASIDEKYIDICILEEPEHLNWYRAPGESWTKKFSHVVGILHTNYFSYALDQPAALIRVRSTTTNDAILSLAFVCPSFLTNI